VKTYSRYKYVFPVTYNLGCGWKSMVNLTSPPPQKEHQMPIEYDAG